MKRVEARHQIGTFLPTHVEGARVSLARATSRHLSNPWSRPLHRPFTTGRSLNEGEVRMDVLAAETLSMAYQKAAHKAVAADEVLFGDGGC